MPLNASINGQLVANVITSVSMLSQSDQLPIV